MPASTEQFCCAGCRSARAIIQSCGLENYYALLANAEAVPASSKATRRTYAEFDDPAFSALYCKPVAASQFLEVELLLEGVHCAACLWLLEKLPRIFPGVVEARVNIRASTLHVVFDPRRLPLSRVGKTLDTLGYPAHPARSPAARRARTVEDRAMLIRIAVAGACAGNIMLLFFALYAGMFTGIEQGPEQLFRWFAMGLNTLCLAWPARVFAKGALASFRTRVITLDLPIALGLYLGGAWGIYKTIVGEGDLYFDSISALVFFLLIGRFVQQRQMRHAADSLELLFSLTPTLARRVNADGSVAEVPTEALCPGDIVDVRPGESAPADGVVISGHSHVDLSVLTGESAPVSVGPDDRIAAGCVNLASPVRMHVDAVGEQTRVGRLLRLVESASHQRAGIVRLADKWGGWLLWVILALAALTLIIWWSAGPALAIDRAAALLIATCPCGLGLATPLAMTVALGRAARKGILIKGADTLQVLDSARGRGTIVLDKTGTLTTGRLSLVQWFGDPDFKPVLAALEAHSAHPVALALVRDLARQAAAPVILTEVTQYPGAGIQAVHNGVPWVAGTRALLESRGVTIDSSFDAHAASALAQHLSPVYLAVADRCVAIAALGDQLRPDAAQVIKQLSAQGLRVEVLSGDHPRIVAHLADRLGIPAHLAHGGFSPEQKLARIRDLATQQSVIMVGDGVNDAAALAVASVGIAVRGGAEASLAAADVSLTREGLAPLLDLFRGARQTMRTIHLTIAASVGYNVIAATLSMMGLISPLLAAIIMPASSLTVLTICLRSNSFTSTKNLP